MTCHCRSNRYSCAGLPLLLFSILNNAMGLISPPKWPSVNPFSHPLGSKIGRKPMVKPSKWANLKSNFLKFHHRNQVISGIEKAREIAYSRAFLALLSCKLALGELRCTTCSLQAVLLLLAKDLEEAYGFPVLVVRPKRCSPPATLMCRRRSRKSFSPSMAILYGTSMIIP